MWPEQDKTVELLKHAKSGDSVAINRLMERHRDVLVRMARTRLHQGMARRVDASDIVQDALIEAHRRLSDYLAQSKIPFHLWLRQIVRDRIADNYRRQMADKRNIARDQSFGRYDSSSLDGMAQIIDADLTPAANLMQKEFEIQFHVALEQLNDESREIVLMRHFEQLSNQQTAELLEISEAAAGMRYLRALRQLKSILKDDPSIESE